VIKITEQEFSLLREYLRRVSGIDIPASKRYLFETRLSHFLEVEGLKGFSDLYDRISQQDEKKLTDGLIQAMTTHESSFFRDSHPFNLLSRRLLPEAARRRQEESIYLPPRIRILSAGCSLGQEPYSIAICVRQWLSTQDRYSDADVTILAADISARALDLAREGTYTDMEIGRHIDTQIRETYFVSKGERWEVCPELKRMVSFARLNLTEPMRSLGKFDIVFCRNVIIDFPVSLKQSILEQVHGILHPHGVLIMGASESVYQLSEDFSVETDGPATYYVRREHGG
jgi:chemotaxis protein methyltransferase CheR